MRVLTVVGNRPQFIKAAAVSHRLRERHEELLVHTGQHYDEELSAIFFSELGLPSPDRELGAGSGTQAAQTAAIMKALEPIVDEAQPELSLIYGDTNSTLAAALVLAKCDVPIAHVEAGMRSFDRTMPEEINRLVADHCSELLLCPSETAVANLRAEGIEGGVHLVGDVMMDVAMLFAPVAERQSGIVEDLGLEAGEYVVVTAHRAGNVDRPARLACLVELLSALERTAVFPVHPRTRGRLEEAGLWSRLERVQGLILRPPVGYLDFLKLLRHSAALVTDSGGAQKEAYLFGVRCVTLRDTTEWVETVELGWNHLVDLDANAVQRALGSPVPDGHPELYGGGKAGERLVEVLTEWAAGSGRSGGT